MSDLTVVKGFPGTVVYGIIRRIGPTANRFRIGQQVIGCSEHGISRYVVASCDSISAMPADVQHR